MIPALRPHLHGASGFQKTECVFSASRQAQETILFAQQAATQKPIACAIDYLFLSFPGNESELVHCAKYVRRYEGDAEHARNSDTVENERRNIFSSLP